MGKGGEIASPLPSRMAVSSSVEIDKIGVDGVAVRRRLPAETIAEDELRLPVKEMLLVVAIEARSLSFGVLGFVGERALQQERFAGESFSKKDVGRGGDEESAVSTKKRHS